MSLVAKLNYIKNAPWTANVEKAHLGLTVILEEVEFLYSRGILEEKKLGRLHEMVKNAR